MGGETGGTAHVVNVVQGTNTVTGDGRNTGIYMRQKRILVATTLNARSGVTIGTQSAPMKQYGIHFHLSPQISAGRGAGADLRQKAGHPAPRETGGTNDATLITNSGNVSGRSHGIYVGSGGRIDFDQTAGTISGRTGVYAGVSKESADGDKGMGARAGRPARCFGRGKVRWRSTARGIAFDSLSAVRGAPLDHGRGFHPPSMVGKIANRSSGWPPSPPGPALTAPEAGAMVRP